MDWQPPQPKSDFFSELGSPWPNSITMSSALGIPARLEGSNVLFRSRLAAKHLPWDSLRMWKPSAFEELPHVEDPPEKGRN